MPRQSNRIAPDGIHHFWTHYLNWSEFLTAAQQPALWDTQINLKHSLNLALYGWPEGREMIKKITEKLNPMESPLRNMKFNESMDVAGFQPDIPSFLSGAPDHMINYGDQSISNAPIIQLQINIDAPSTLGDTYLKNQAVATASLCDALETQGYQTEIRLANATHSINNNKKSLTMFTCEFKRAGETLDLDRTVFALGHSAILRHFLFSIYKSNLEIKTRFRSTMGEPTDHIPDDYTDPGVINIPPPDLDCQTVESSIRRIIKFIKEGNPTVNWNILNIILDLLDQIEKNAMKIPHSNYIH